MTPEQISLVQTSFDRLSSDLPALTTHFYEDLFERDPSLRSLFPADLEEQKVRFAEKLTEIVRAISDLEGLLAQTRALGVRHAAYAVRASYYDTVGTALLAALAGASGGAMDPETREAWTMAYSLVAETMLEGATAARRGGA
jgi:hemoglobin-like flavoprotein